MGEALITRRGSGGVKRGIADKANSEKVLIIPALIGVKNAIVSPNANVSLGRHNSGSALMIELRDGAVYKALRTNGSGLAMNSTANITFDSATGTFTSVKSSTIHFNTSTDNCYEYIIFD